MDTPSAASTRPEFTGEPNANTPPPNSGARRWARHQCHLEAIYQTAHEPDQPRHRGVVVNLSRGGLCLIAQQLHPVESLFDVRLPLLGKHLLVRVLHAKAV